MLDFPSSPTSGQILQPAAAGALVYEAPAWRRAPGWTRVFQINNIAPTPTYDLVLPAGYRNFKLMLRGFFPVVASSFLVARVSIDSGASYYAASGDYDFSAYYSGAGAMARFGSDGVASNALQLSAGATDTSAGDAAFCDIDISPSQMGGVSWRGGTCSTAFGTPYFCEGAGYAKGAAGRWTNFRILSGAGGNFTVRAIDLIGMK